LKSVRIATIFTDQENKQEYGMADIDFYRAWRNKSGYEKHQ